MKYHFYLMSDFKINASVKDKKDCIYINTIDCRDSMEMLGTIEILQNTVDATLLQSDEQRKQIENMKNGELN